ncbi:MAG: ABC transporter permease [Clostridiales bacterium]|nr:ABC transporter permease [Clostridiales bacterium]MDD7675521.1 ABC transporter permease [Eubacteriales bacterium]
MQEYKTVIKPKRAWFDLNLKELFRYRDLIMLFVRRTFVSQYKQTILGPAWAVIQPLLTTVVLTVVFGNIAGLAPSGVPTFAFYMCGSIAWGYFSSCLTATSHTFTANSAILGKVYFPRLVMPVSTVLSQLISFAVQFCFFLIFLFYYLITGANVHPNLWVLLTPVILLHLALLSLGVGIIISALTTKYRDLAMVVGFGVQLWMYATPVAYDLSMIPERFLGVYMLNPVTPVITLFRYAFLGVGEPHFAAYGISWLITIAVLFVGILLFNRVEKTFMDTV